MAWRRLLFGVALVLVTGPVFAAALPDQSTLTITTSDGTLVGSGTYVGGNLLLDLSNSYAGDATLTVTTRGGGTLTYGVTVHANGSVTLTSSGAPLQDINRSVTARGGTVTIKQVEQAKLTAPALPGVAPGPNAHSTQGINNAAAAASVGVSHASPHAGAGSGNGKP